MSAYQETRRAIHTHKQATLLCNLYSFQFLFLFAFRCRPSTEFCVTLRHRRNSKTVTITMHKRQMQSMPQWTNCGSSTDKHGHGPLPGILVVPRLVESLRRTACPRCRRLSQRQLSKMATCSKSVSTLYSLPSLAILWCHLKKLQIAFDHFYTNTN